jgi:hypothetical protein
MLNFIMHLKKVFCSILLILSVSEILQAINLEKIDKLHHDGKYQEAYDELKKQFDPDKPDPAIIRRIGEEIFVLADLIPDYNRKLKIEKYDEGISFLGKYLDIKSGTERDRSAIIHWYTSNLALKYYTIGIFESIRNLSKIMELNELAIQTDPTYADPYYFKANLLDILPVFMGGDEVKMGYYYSLAVKYASNDINILIDGAKSFNKRNWPLPKIKKEYSAQGLQPPLISDREYSRLLTGNAISIYESNSEPSSHDKIKINEAYKLRKRLMNEY